MKIIRRNFLFIFSISLMWYKNQYRKIIRTRNIETDYVIWMKYLYWKIWSSSTLLLCLGYFQNLRPGRFWGEGQAFLTPGQEEGQGYFDLWSGGGACWILNTDRARSPAPDVNSWKLPRCTQLPSLTVKCPGPFTWGGVKARPLSKRCRPLTGVNSMTSFS